MTGPGLAVAPGAIGPGGGHPAANAKPAKEQGSGGPPGDRPPPGPQKSPLRRGWFTLSLQAPVSLEMSQRRYSARSSGPAFSSFLERDALREKRR